MEEMDYEIFKGIGFKDLCQDIYKNQVSRKEQIDVFIADLRPLIKSVNDAMIVVPLIKGYLDTGNTNDDHLVRLASIIQKIMTAHAATDSSGAGGNVGLSEEEKKQIMEEIERVAKDEKNVDKAMDDLTEEKNTIQPVININSTAPKDK